MLEKDSQFDLAMLLSVEAGRAADTYESRNAAVTLVQSLPNLVHVLQGKSRSAPRTQHSPSARDKPGWPISRRECGQTRDRPGSFCLRSCHAFVRGRHRPPGAHLLHRPNHRCPIMASTIHPSASASDRSLPSWPSGCSLSNLKRLLQLSQASPSPRAISLPSRGHHSPDSRFVNVDRLQTSRPFDDSLQRWHSNATSASKRPSQPPSVLMNAGSTRWSTKHPLDFTSVSGARIRSPWLT